MIHQELSGKIIGAALEVFNESDLAQPSAATVFVMSRGVETSLDFNR